MMNFIENNPIYSLLSAFVLGVGAAWTLITFTLSDKVELLHDSEMNALNAQMQQHINRIEILESENETLTTLNELYWDCISSNPDLTVYIKGELEKMISAYNVLNKSKLSVLRNCGDTLGIVNNDVKEVFDSVIKEQIKKNEAYVDYELGIVIGVNEINFDDKAEVNISVGGKPIVEKDFVGAGKTYTVTIKDNQCLIIIEKINYVYGYVNIIISRISK